MRKILAKLSLTGVFVLVGTLPIASTSHADAADRCNAPDVPHFVFGFADLRNRVGTPLGDARTCEFADPSGTGDIHQQTTTGLAFWRKSTNTPTFTDGFNHWALTSTGVVTWTGSSIDPPRSSADEGAYVTTLAAIRQRGIAIQAVVDRAVGGAKAGQYTSATAGVLIDQQREAWLQLEGDLTTVDPPARYAHAHELFLNGIAEYRETLGWLSLTGATGLSAYAAIADQHNQAANDWFRQAETELVRLTTS